MCSYTQLCMDYDFDVVRRPCNSDSDSEGNACEEISVWSTILAKDVDFCLNPALDLVT